VRLKAESAVHTCCIAQCVCVRAWCVGVLADGQPFTLSTLGAHKLRICVEQVGAGVGDRMPWCG